MINFFNDFYYVIYSMSSRNNGGLKPKAMFVSGKDIFDAANYELNKSGSNLEDMAGIPMIEIDGDMEYERYLTEDEILNYSVEKLGDDGRLYEIFKIDENGQAEFLESANYWGIQDKAQIIIEKFN